MVTLSDINKAFNLDPDNIKQVTANYGKVVSINPDKTYQVSLNGSDTTVKCARLTGAKVGDVVLVTTLKNGYSVVTGCVGGDTDAADAQATADSTAQYFWYDTDGAHVTEIPKDDFISTPSGGNLLMGINGIKIRDGLIDLAAFGAMSAQIGKTTDSHVIIAANAFKMQGANNAYSARITWDMYGNIDIAGYIFNDIKTYLKLREHGIQAPNVQQMIEGQPAAVVTLSTTYKKVTLIDGSVLGDQFEISNGGIKCLRDGYVMVSGQVQFLDMNDTNLLDMQIRLGSEIVAESAARGTGDRAQLAITPRKCTVSENDILYMYVSNRSSANGTACGAAGGDPDTDKSYMTVQYI